MQIGSEASGGTYPRGRDRQCRHETVTPSRGERDWGNLGNDGPMRRAPRGSETGVWEMGCRMSIETDGGYDMSPETWRSTRGPVGGERLVAVFQEESRCRRGEGSWQTRRGDRGMTRSWPVVVAVVWWIYSTASVLHPALPPERALSQPPAAAEKHVGVP